MEDDTKEPQMDGFADVVIGVGNDGRYVVLSVLNNPHLSVLEELEIDERGANIDADPGVYRVKFCVEYDDEVWGTSCNFDDIRRLADGADLPELLCPIQPEDYHAIPCKWCGNTSYAIMNSTRGIGKARIECTCGHCGPWVRGEVNLHDMSGVPLAIRAWNAVNAPA